MSAESKSVTRETGDRPRACLAGRFFARLVFFGFFAGFFAPREVETA